MTIPFSDTPYRIKYNVYKNAYFDKYVFKLQVRKWWGYKTVKVLICSCFSLWYASNPFFVMSKGECWHAKRFDVKERGRLLYQEYLKEL